MTKRDRKNKQLADHYAALERLAKFQGREISGKKLSLILWRLENSVNPAATAYCNGEIDGDKWEEIASEAKERVYELLGDIPGFFINGDPRGYSLKIDASIHDPIYDLGLHRDFGGYLILSPEITGNQ